ncbi:MAG: hypothetical protein A4S09_09540 [Proteobacteria bacterium SG_bin7]|nr:MAG: hypothetical protein A4S09_09540 [Proteobacteria bacterium SG_bin7]
MKTLFIKVLLLGFIYQTAPAQEVANYYRVWQGFQRSDISGAQFLGDLPGFMRDTIKMYEGRALSNYIVVIPPKDSPDFLPHEFALVALTSEESYRYIRSTSEGKRYADRHWDVFDKKLSKSAPFVVYDDTRVRKLESNVSYDMFGQPLNWSLGHTVVFVGIRKPEVSKQDFMARLQNHIELARNVMSSRGLHGYIVVANENYEVAYLNWNSKKSHDSSVASDAGKLVFGDAGKFMNPLMYQEPVIYSGGSVELNKVYQAK